MDYTNFVKTYYKAVVNKLNRFSKYNGSFAYVIRPIEISNIEIYQKNMNFDALPNFEVNINSSVDNFENYLQFIYENTPDLAIIALGKKRLKEFFEKYISNEKDEENFIEKIDLLTDIFIDFLHMQGVIN